MLSRNQTFRDIIWKYIESRYYRRKMEETNNDKIHATEKILYCIASSNINTFW